MEKTPTACPIDLWPISVFIVPSRERPPMFQGNVNFKALYKEGWIKIGNLSILFNSILISSNSIITNGGDILMALFATISCLHHTSEPVRYYFRAFGKFVGTRYFMSYFADLLQSFLCSSSTVFASHSAASANRAIRFDIQVYRRCMVSTPASVEIETRDVS